MPWVGACYKSTMGAAGDGSRKDIVERAQDWALFERVEAHDTGVRDAALVGDSSSGATWYVFADSVERASYVRGRRLHAQADPARDYTPTRNLLLTTQQQAHVGSTTEDSSPCRSTPERGAVSESTRLRANRSVLASTMPRPYGDESVRIAASTC